MAKEISQQKLDSKKKAGAHQPQRPEEPNEESLIEKVLAKAIEENSQIASSMRDVSTEMSKAASAIGEANAGRSAVITSTLKSIDASLTEISVALNKPKRLKVVRDKDKILDYVDIVPLRKKMRK